MATYFTALAAVSLAVVAFQCSCFFSYQESKKDLVDLSLACPEL